jgi:4-amino-4-deoxy-L-arabinose transferase-like glycosyltransferase
MPVQVKVLQRTLLYILLLAAFFLRVHQLGAQDLWFDEAWSAHLVAQDPGTVFQQTGLDIHPPLYYYLLQATVPLFGDREFALRYPSLVVGMALVALVYVVGKRLGDHGTGMLAMILILLSPLHVYYSQEARMYEWIAFLSLLGFYALLRAMKPDRKWWIVVSVANTLMLYSHYMSIPLLIAQNVYFLVRWLRNRKEGLTGLVRQGIPWLLFLPWLAFAGHSIVSRRGLGMSIPLKVTLQDTVVWLSLGLTAYPSKVPVPFGILLAGLLLGGLALWGIVLRPARIGSLYPEDQPRLWLGLYLVIPLVFLWAGTLMTPYLAPRYLVPLSVPYLLALARALRRGMMVGRAGRWGVAGGMVALGLLWAFSLNNLYYEEAYRKGHRYREVIAYVEKHARPEDGLILTFPFQQPLFRYYYADSLPTVYEIPTREEWFHLRLDPAKDVAMLQKASARHRRLWLVQFYGTNLDDGGILEAWLQAHCYPAADRWFDLTRVMLFVGRREEGPTHPVGVSLGEAARLRGFDLEPVYVAPGGQLRLTLYWEPLSPTSSPYAVFTHLEDVRGNLWGQDDHSPGWGSFPTTQWTEERLLADEYVIPVQADTPPGEYRLLVGMYDPESGKRLRIHDKDGRDIGDALLLTKVYVP